MIEGTWKSLYFKIASSKDYQKISQFLSINYYRDEPITEMLGWTEKKENDTDSVVEACLPHRLTLYAEDTKTQEVVAVRVGYDSRRKFDLDDLFQCEDNFKVQVLKNQLVCDAQEILNEKYPEDGYAVGFLSSVSPNYRGQGIATEIYRRSILLFRKNGFLIARNFFSSKITMKIVRKLGYEELSRVYLRELRNDDGLLVFPQAGPDFYATLMVIRL